MQTYEDWPPELYLTLDKFKQKMQSYGYLTDFDEVYEQTMMAVLICQHKMSQHDRRLNIMGLSLLAELTYLPYKQRKKEVERVARLYAEYISQKKKKRAEVDRVARKKGEGKKREDQKAEKPTGPAKHHGGREDR